MADEISVVGAAMNEWAGLPEDQVARWLDLGGEPAFIVYKLKEYATGYDVVVQLDDYDPYLAECIEFGHCPDCGCDPDDHSLHANGCARLGTDLQYLERTLKGR